MPFPAEPAPEEDLDVPDPEPEEEPVPEAVSALEEEPGLEAVSALEEEPAECDLTATVVVLCVVCPSAGSCPVTSWTSTAPLAARNVASDMPATRRRIARARCRRAASFSLAAARRLR